MKSLLTSPVVIIVYWKCQKFATAWLVLVSSTFFARRHSMTSNSILANYLYILFQLLCLEVKYLSFASIAAFMLSLVIIIIIMQRLTCRMSVIRWQITGAKLERLERCTAYQESKRWLCRSIPGLNASFFLPRDAMLVWYMLWPCVCQSVTSHSSTKTARYRIILTLAHNSSGNLVLWRQRSPQNSTGVNPYGGGASNAGRVG